MLAHNLLIWWIAQVAAIAILLYFILVHHWGFLGGRTITSMLAGMLDTRANRIDEQLRAAERSREEARLIREQTAQEVERARREAQQIVSRAAGTSEAIRHEIEVRARADYERILEQAKVEIALERERAEQALQRRAADIVVDAAEQVISTHLQPQSDRRLIESSLDNLKELA